MHILYVHQHFSTPKGSGSIRSYMFAKKLIAQGHKVTLICGSNKKAHTGLSGPFKRGIRQGCVEGINLIEINVPYSNHDGLLKRAWKFCFFALRSTSLTFTVNYDLIFTSSTPLTVALPGVVAKLFRRKPFIFEVRDLWPELPHAMGLIKNRFVLTLLRTLEKTAYLTANRCIGLSPGMCEGIEKCGINSKKISMIPNGCDLELFSANEPSPRVEHLWQKNFSDSDCVAIFAGAHGLANGLDAVLDSAKVLKGQQANSIKLLFIGDGKLKPHLKQRVEQEGLSNCVFWEPLPKLEIRSLLKKADIGLMILSNIPGFYNGTSPNKFFDYIASGLPVLNNYPGWLAGLISAHHCGKVTPPDNPEQFAQALIELAELSDEQRRQYSQNALKLAEQHFNREVLSEQFVKLCETVYTERYPGKVVDSMEH